MADPTHALRVYAAAREVAPRFSVPPTVPAVIAVREQGWQPKGVSLAHNNFWGLKSKGDLGYYDAHTGEDWGGGRLTRIRSKFGSFSSLEAGVEGFCRFFHSPRAQNRYGIALDRFHEDRDALGFVLCVWAGGYATAREYLGLVRRIYADLYDHTGDDAWRPGWTPAMAALEGAVVAASYDPPKGWRRAKNQIAARDRMLPAVLAERLGRDAQGC